MWSGSSFWRAVTIQSVICVTDATHPLRMIAAVATRSGGFPRSFATALRFVSLEVDLSASVALPEVIIGDDRSGLGYRLVVPQGIGERHLATDLHHICILGGNGRVAVGALHPADLALPHVCGSSVSGCPQSWQWVGAIHRTIGKRSLSAASS